MARRNKHSGRLEQDACRLSTPWLRRAFVRGETLLALRPRDAFTLSLPLTIERIMTNLKGFWKESNIPQGNITPFSDVSRYAKPKVLKSLKKRKIRCPSKDDDFYQCEAWRRVRYLAIRNCNGRCQCCGASAKDGVRIHVDHIKPRSKFPHLQLKLNNLQVLCEDCNIGKGNWDITDWRELKNFQD